MSKQLHINVLIDLPDDHWAESDMKTTIKPLYDQFSQALTAAGITFRDNIKPLNTRPPKPKIETVTTTAAPPVAA